MLGQHATVERALQYQSFQPLGTVDGSALLDSDTPPYMPIQYRVTLSGPLVSSRSLPQTAFSPGAAPAVTAANAPTGVRLDFAKGIAVPTYEYARAVDGGAFETQGYIEGGQVAPCDPGADCAYVVWGDYVGAPGLISAPVSGRRLPAPPSPRGHGGTNHVALDWADRPIDADHFVISRGASESGPFTAIGSTAELSFVDDAPPPLAISYYEVQSATADGGLSLPSYALAAVGTTTPDAMNVGAQGDAGTITPTGELVTVTQGGTLAGVELAWPYATPVPAAELTVRSGENVLAAHVLQAPLPYSGVSAELSATEVYGQYYDLTPYGITVSPGQRLELDAPGASFTGATLGNGTQAGAALPSADLLFKTYVAAADTMVAPSFAAEAGDEGIGLSWSASPGADHYDVIADPGSPAEHVITSTAQTWFIDTPLAPFSTHTYAVRAVGATQALSGVVSAMTRPGLVDQLNLAEAASAAPSASTLYADPLGQTATLSQAGQLLGVEVMEDAPVETTLTVRLNGALAGSATATPSGRSAIPRPLSRVLRRGTYFDLSAQQIQVAAGDVVELDFAAANGTWVSLRAGPDAYAAGSLISTTPDATRDLAFKLIVAP